LSSYAAYVPISGLLGWLALIPLVAVGWVVWRGGGIAALSTLRTANEVLEKRNDLLEERVGELERLRAEDQETIGELRGRTDVTIALMPLASELALHEVAAERRNEKILTVLNLIANRLGPDT
jgi:hypothetical protein